jgi:hypothetical protein
MPMLVCTCHVGQVFSVLGCIDEEVIGCAAVSKDATKHASVPNGNAGDYMSGFQRAGLAEGHLAMQLYDMPHALASRGAALTRAQQSHTSRVCVGGHRAGQQLVVTHVSCGLLLHRRSGRVCWPAPMCCV